MKRYQFRHYGLEIVLIGTLALVPASWIILLGWVPESLGNVIASLALAVAASGVALMAFHGRKGSCAHCVSRALANDSEEAAKRKQEWLRFEHANVQSFLMALLALAVLGAVALEADDVLVAGLGSVFLVWFAVDLRASSLHRQARRWCPYCAGKHRDEDTKSQAT